MEVVVLEALLEVFGFEVEELLKLWMELMCLLVLCSVLVSLFPLGE